MDEKRSDCEKLWAHLLTECPAAGFELHGAGHWRQVEKNGLLLAAETGADETVIRLFALFHDSCRTNEGIDDGHGARGAELARRLRGSHYDLDDDRFALLVEACACHTEAEQHINPTIATCLDADRLDLGRVGIIPDPKRMCTAAGRRAAQGR